MASLFPTISYFLLTFFFRTLVSTANFLKSRAFFTVINKRFKSSGFSIKSKAPFFMASTAVSTVPCPEIIIKRASVPCFIALAKSSIPSIPGIFISHKTISNSVSSKFFNAVFPSSASVTSCFSYSKISFKELRIALSSSVTNIFAIVKIFTKIILEQDFTKTCFSFYAKAIFPERFLILIFSS